MHSLLPHGYFIFGSDVKLCKEIVLDPDLEGFREGWEEWLFSAGNEVS